MKTETMGRNKLIEKIDELEKKIEKWCEEQCPVRIARNWDKEVCKRNCCLYNHD